MKFSTLDNYKLKKKKTAFLGCDKFKKKKLKKLKTEGPISKIKDKP